MEMTITDFARMGGKSRWKGTSKKERSKAMSELARLSWKNRKTKKNGVCKPKLQHKKAIRKVI